MVVIKVGIHKMLVRIANKVYPHQTASSDLGLCCLSRPFWQSTSVQILELYMTLIITRFFFVLKMLSTVFVCCLYSVAFQTSFYHESKYYEP